MKKFYAIALVAMAAMSANAQNGAPLYATGAGPAFDPSWAPAEAAQFTYADGVYTLELKGLTMFKLSTALGDANGTTDEEKWAPFNAGALTCNYGETPGVEVALEAGDDNISAPYLGDYTVTVSGDLKTIKLETASERTYPDIYFRGDMNNWGNDGLTDEWKFQHNEDGTIYAFTCAEGQSIQPGVAFKIADETWGVANYAYVDGAVELDMEYECVWDSGSNTTLAEEWNGTCILTITGVHQAKVEFQSEKNDNPFGEGAVNTINVDDNAAAVYYNLQGVRVANPENGLFIVVKNGKAVKQIVK